MTDITLRYWISSELRRAANDFTTKKNWAAHLFYSMGILGLPVGQYFPEQKSFIALFSIACFAAYFWRLFRGCFVFGKSGEEISLTMREDGLSCSGAKGQQLYPWTRLLEIREIREKKSGNDWLFILLKAPHTNLPRMLPDSMKAVLPVPFSAFADDAARQAFVEAVNARIHRPERDSLRSNEFAQCHR